MTGLTNPPPKHPTEFSVEIIEALSTMLPATVPIHDPFAGRGLRLGALCDRLGVTYTGTDTESYIEPDRRVGQGDSADPATYPPAPFTIVTSPVYMNRISTDYVGGPTPTTKLNGRHAYGISLGRALHPANLARRCRRATDYYPGHAAVVAHWGQAAYVNVDLPISEGWTQVLEGAGYRITGVVEVKTRRLGGVANAEKRAPHEVILVAEKRGQP
jgi:hypothetical protein